MGQKIFAVIIQQVLGIYNLDMKKYVKSSLRVGNNQVAGGMGVQNDNSCCAGCGLCRIMICKKFIGYAAVACDALA